MTLSVVELASRRRHAAGGYLCCICGSRWDCSKAAGWCLREPLKLGC